MLLTMLKRSYRVVSWPTTVTLWLKRKKLVERSEGEITTRPGAVTRGASAAVVQHGYVTSEESDEAQRQP